MDYMHINTGFILRLDRGDSVAELLRQFAAEQRIPAAFISAVGALRDVTLGYFDLNLKEYRKKQFTGIYELVSFQGNLAALNGEPIWHIHTVLADREMQVVGGHFFDAQVAVTFEAHIITEDILLHRKPDSETGLNLLNLT